MGHDHHFLSRLDRVHTQQADLALSLYRDDELIRRILTMAEVPEAAERIAISLDDERRGPFIIVARNGHFVTCLGEGMGVRDLHVISRARLDDIAQYISVLRDRIRQAKVSAGGQTDMLIESLHTSGRNLSREEFRGLLSITELLRPLALELLYRDLKLVMMESAPAVFRARGTTAREEQLSRGFYKMIWAHAHLQLIVGAEWQPGNPDPLSLMPGVVNNRAVNHRSRVSRIGVCLGWMPATLRAVRTATLGGKDILPSLAEFWNAPVDVSTAAHALFSLVGVAVRNPSTREAVREILSKPPGPGTNRQDAWKGFHQMLHRHALSAIDAPETAVAKTINLGRTFVLRHGQHLPIGAIAHYENAHEVPEELACAEVANCLLGSLDLNVGTFVALNASAWAATAPAEAFYPEGAYLTSLRPRWSFETAKGIAECVCQQLLKRTKETPEVRQKPNEPCSCGSGKKYKKCCGGSGGGVTQA